MRATPAATPGGGIQFGVHNSGSYLWVTTTDGVPFFDTGIHFDLTNGHGFQVTTGAYPDGGDIQLLSAGAHAFLTLNGAQGGADLGIASLSSQDETSILSGDAILIWGTRLGFFAATPVAQPAHPVTLGDVILALTQLGLTA